MDRLAETGRALDPRFSITVARGSPDRVCTFLKYASALLLGVPVAAECPVHVDRSPVPVALEGGSPFTLGRGSGWAMTDEAALKFKETFHAESYSSAEAMHGPVSIVDRGFPILALAAGDAVEPSLVDVADRLAAKGSHVFASSDRAACATPIPSVRPQHWLANPIASIISFCALVEHVARARGGNPDPPRHLQKATETPR